MDAPTPQSAPPPSGTPPAPPRDSEGSQISEIYGVPPAYVYIHTHLPNNQFFNQDEYAKDQKQDRDFILDLLTDEGPFSGYYTICCMVMLLISILQTKVAFWANLTVKMSMDWRELDFLVLLLSTISGHFKLYFKGYDYMHY